MRCEVAIISLTYLIWKKKEEERVVSQQRTWRLDKGLNRSLRLTGWKVAKGRQKSPQLRWEPGRGVGAGNGRGDKGNEMQSYACWEVLALIRMCMYSIYLSLKPINKAGALAITDVCRHFTRPLF